MQGILDAPVTANVPGQRPHFGRQAAEEIGHLVTFLAARFATAVDHAHRADVDPLAAQLRRGLHDVVFAAFHAAMALFARRVPLHALPVVVAQLGKQGLQLVMQRRLIGLHLQHVVGAATADGAGRLLLAVHGIESHDGPLDGQHLQQPRHGRDLVRFLFGGQLTERESQLAGPGIDHMQGLSANRFVEGLPQRFAVDGDGLTAQVQLQAGNPIGQAGVELARIERREHPAERVVRRHAVLQPQERAEPGELLIAEPLDVGPRIGATQRDGHQVAQMMPLRALHARVLQVLEVCKNDRGFCKRHAPTSMLEMLSPGRSTRPAGLPTLRRNNPSRSR